MGVFFLLFSAIFFPVISPAAQGELDTAFNSPSGYITYYTIGGGGRQNAVAVQRDGKVVVADTYSPSGDSGADIMVRRYNADGSVDTAFGTNGVANYDENFYSFSTDMAIQKDGKIVVAGMRLNTLGNFYDLILLRFNSNGVLDTGFGSGGVVIYEARQWYDWTRTINVIAIQDDGKIVVGGYTLNFAGDSNDMLLLRFNSNGALDTSFGSGGVVTYDTYSFEAPESPPYNAADVVARKVKITGDGKIAVLIQANHCAAVLLYNSNGTLNSESKPFCGMFEVPGWGIGATAQGMDIQKDGKIVITGEGGLGLFVLRFTGDLDFDRPFGTAEFGGGTYFHCSTFFGYAEDDWRFNYVHNMVIQPDGKIVVVGNCPIDRDGDNYSDDQDLLVFRLNTGGGLDTGFAGGGVFTFDGGWHAGGELGDVGMSVAIQPDGQIVVAGPYMVADPETYDHHDGIVLRLDGEPLGDIEVSPVSYDFGSVTMPGSKSQSFTISNRGKADLSVTKVEIIGGDAGMFQLAKGTCANLGSFTLSPGKSCNVSVTFNPSSSGGKETVLRITSNDPYDPWKDQVPWNVTLIGTGVMPAETVSAPTTPSGSANGTTGTSYSYSVSGSTSSLGHSVQYKFDWGDGTESGWLAVGTTSASKSWSSAGTKSVKVKARCSGDTSVESGWSVIQSVNISAAPSITLIAPSDGQTFTACSYYDLPTFQWNVSGTFKTIELQFSTQNDFAASLIKVKGSVTSSSLTMKSSTWKKILLLPGTSGGTVFWKVVGTLTDKAKTKVESSVSSLLIGGPQAVGNPQLSHYNRTATPPPTISWLNNCNIKFKAWFGSDSNFTKKKSFSFTDSAPTDNGGVFSKELSSSKWSSIRKLVGDASGAKIHWYVESWDALNRKSTTSAMSFELE